MTDTDKMVILPADLFARAVSILGSLEPTIDLSCDLRLAVQPAEQHQGVPVAWIVVSPDDLEPVKGVAHTKEGAEQFKASGWAVTPLYTHADPAGDPTGSFDKHMEYMDRCHKLEKKLAEVHALLRELHAAFENDQHPWIPGGNAQPAKSKLDAFLYASAEPSAPIEVVGVDPLEGEGDGGPHEARLMAQRAPVERDEPVAWFTEDHLTDKSATTWDSTVADRWRAKGWPVGELFARAALERKP